MKLFIFMFFIRMNQEKDRKYATNLSLLSELIVHWI